MTTLKSVLAAIGVAILMVLGAFGVGRFRGVNRLKKKQTDSAQKKRPRPLSQQPNAG